MKAPTTTEESEEFLKEIREFNRPMGGHQSKKNRGFLGRFIDHLADVNQKDLGRVRACYQKDCHWNHQFWIG